MSRYVLIVLLAMGLVLAEAPAKTDAAQGQSEAAPAKTDAAQGQSEAAPAKADAAQGQSETAPAKTEEEGKLVSVPGAKALGMSLLGNREAPLSLVIVPWKSSELGKVVGISPMLDDSRLPIEKEVFMRMLSYYEIRSETARPGSAPTKTSAAQPITAAPRRKP
jgi:hypothetical protein